MAKQIIQNRFDGGIAEDVRTSASNECEISTNFDIFNNPHKLIHHYDQSLETDFGAIIDDVEMTDVGMTKVVATNYMVAFGYNTSSTTLPASHIRTAFDFNGSWTQQAVGVASYSYNKGTYIQYGGISFVLTNNGTTYNLQKYTGAGTMTSVGTFTVSAVPSVVPRPYIHPEDKILYMVVGTSIATYNIASGSFQQYTTILPTGYTGTCISHYGGYLTIGMVPDLPGDSLMLLWGRDGTLNTLQGSINVGRLYLQSLHNIEGSVIAISRSVNANAFISKTIEVKQYSGGDSYRLVKLIDIPSASTTNYNIVSCKKDEAVYFAIGGEKAVYRVGRNSQGRFAITQDRLIDSGSAVDNVYSISFVGDYMYVAFSVGGVYKLSTTNESNTQVNSAIYRQTINSNMPEADRALEKKLSHIEVLFEGVSTSGTSTVRYIVDGTTGTVGSKTNVSGNFVIKGKGESTGTPFKNGRDIQIEVETTFGTNVKEIRYIYESINLI